MAHRTVKDVMTAEVIAVAGGAVVPLTAEIPATDLVMVSSHEVSPQALDRTAEAIVFTWEGAAGEGADSPGRRPPVPPLRRRVESLCSAGVDVAVISRADVADVAARLRVRPRGPGRVLLSDGRGPVVELGPGDHRRVHRRPAARAAGPDPMRHILAILAARGAGPGLVLVVTDQSAPGGGYHRLLLVPEGARATSVSVGAAPAGTAPGVIHLGGGRPALLRLMDAQLRRRDRGRVPAVDEDPAWILTDAGHDPGRRRVDETLFTVGSGGVATRGSAEEAVRGGTPMVLAAGVYDGTGSAQHLLPGPLWTGLTVAPPAPAGTRILDLRTGVLARTTESGAGGRLRTLRFASAMAPGVVAMRAEAPAGQLRSPGPPLQAPDGQAGEARWENGRFWARTDSGCGGGLGALAVQRTSRDAGLRTVQRIAAYVACPSRRPERGMAAGALSMAEERGFDRLLAEHRAAWAVRWDEVDAQIPDDPDVQLAIRFALFQLWSNTAATGELAVGARGLAGSGYAGHVFWDADVFVLPALVSIEPAAAAAMVRYRLRRLAAARARACADGRRGARFPWESAASGEEVAPSSMMFGGRLVPVTTGLYEEHVTADVAWAAVRCAEWTGGRALPGLPLLVQTARYWASRCRLDGAGAAHIDGVTGPDEYHERVDDNAYTNVMARWNLRAAADAADRMPVTAQESGWWRELAGRIVDGYDSATGRYEQFAGYYCLEPLLMAGVAAPPVAADLLLGRERIVASQVIKQPDVLMLHHMVPGEVAPRSLIPNLDFYGPRTSHGSSLSPAITASLLARAGRPDEALAMLRTALAIDLSDLTGTTAAGLHIANLGGVWQAMLSGFAGVGVQAGALSVDPRLPAAWGSLHLRFRCLGRRVRLHITRERVEITTDAPLLAGLAGQEPRRVTGHCSLGPPGKGS